MNPYHRTNRATGSSSAIAVATHHSNDTNNNASRSCMSRRSNDSNQDGCHRTYVEQFGTIPTATDNDTTTTTTPTTHTTTSVNVAGATMTNLPLQRQRRSSSSSSSLLPPLLQALHRSYISHDDDDDDDDNDDKHPTTSLQHKQTPPTKTLTLAQCLRRKGIPPSMEVTRTLQQQTFHDSTTASASAIKNMKESLQYIITTIIPSIIQQQPPSPSPSPPPSLTGNVAPTTTTSSTKTTWSLMDGIEQIATIGRFIEYLCEYKNNQKNNNNDNDDDDTVRSMIVQLIHSITNMIVTMHINNSNNSTGSESKNSSSNGTAKESVSSCYALDDDVEHLYHTMNLYTFDSNQQQCASTTIKRISTIILVLSIHVFGTLIRYNYYCRNGHPYILSTLYKSLCRIVSIISISDENNNSTTSTMNNNNNQTSNRRSGGSSNSSIIPLALRQQTISMILEHIYDGMDTIIQQLIVVIIIEPSSTAISSSSSSSTMSAAPTSIREHHQPQNATLIAVEKISPIVLKIVTFLISRLHTFITANNANKQMITNSNEKVTDETTFGDDDSNVISALLQCRGLMKFVTTLSLSSSTVSTNDTAVAAMCFKIDECLLSITNNSNSDINNSSQHTNVSSTTTGIDRITKSCFISSFRHDNSNNQTIDVMVHEMIFCIGKLHVSMNYLTEMRQYYENNNNMNNIIRTNDRGIDSVVDVIEELLVRTIPMTFLLIQRFYQKYSYSNHHQCTFTNRLVPSETFLPIIVTTLLQLEDIIIQSTKRSSPNLGTINDDGTTGSNCQWNLDRFYQLLIHWLSLHRVVVRPYSDDDNGSHDVHMSSPTLDWMIHIFVQYIDIVYANNCAIEATANDTTTNQKYPLLVVVIQLLWDIRTDTNLRHAISCIIICLLSKHVTSLQLPVSVTLDDNISINPNRDSNTSTTKNISFVVGEAILSQVHSYLKGPSRKRKRFATDSDDGDDDCSSASTRAAQNLPTLSSQQPQSLKNTKDLQIILSVISNIPAICTNEFNEILPDYIQSFVSCLAKKDTLQPNIHEYDLHNLSIFTSLLHLYQQSHQLYETLLSQANALFVTISQEVNGKRVNGDEWLIQYGQLWIWSVLRHLRWYCQRTERIEDPSNFIVIKGAVDLLHTVVRGPDIIRGEGIYKKNELLVAVLVEAVQVLGEIGCFFDERSVKILPLERLHQMLHSLSESFYAVLSSAYWTIRLQCITTLVQFAKTIHFTYKSILPKCVPPNMQQILQCRLRNKVWAEDTTDIHSLHVQSIDMLYNALRNQPLSSLRQHKNGVMEVQERKEIINESTTASSYCYTVPIGSYCMTMPTQEGRNALVIFPPNAIDDLRTMIRQQQDDEDNDDEDDDTGAVSSEWMKERNIQQIRKTTMLNFD